MNEVWTKSLQLHFQRLYPGETTIKIEELSEAFKLIEGSEKNQFIGYAIRSKIEDKNNPEDIVNFQEIKNRIESTYCDTKDTMYMDAYFKLIDEDGDGFITHSDLEAHTNELGFPCMNEKAFLALTERFHHDSTKLGKPEFIQIIRQYI